MTSLALRLGFLAAALASIPAQATTLTYGSGTIHNHVDDNGKSVVTLNPDYIESGGCCFLTLDPSAAFQNAMTKLFHQPARQNRPAKSLLSHLQQ